MSTTVTNRRVTPVRDEHSWTDEELLLRYRKTNRRELFAVLVKRYETELFNYLRRYTGDPELAEDVFQATFLTVHLKAGQFQEGRRFRPWLYTIATNQAIDFQRSGQRHRLMSLERSGGHDEQGQTTRLIDLLVSDEPDPLLQAGDGEFTQLVREALTILDEQDQRMVHLVYFQGLKYREAAEVLSIPVGTVKSRMHEAIHRLADYWKRTHTQSV